MAEPVKKEEKPKREAKAEAPVLDDKREKMQSALFAGIEASPEKIESPELKDEAPSTQMDLLSMDEPTAAASSTNAGSLLDVDSVPYQ